MSGKKKYMEMFGSFTEPFNCAVFQRLLHVRPGLHGLSKEWPLRIAVVSFFYTPDTLLVVQQLCQSTEGIWIWRVCYKSGLRCEWNSVNLCNMLSDLSDMDSICNAAVSVFASKWNGPAWYDCGTEWSQPRSSVGRSLSAISRQSQC